MTDHKELFIASMPDAERAARVINQIDKLHGWSAIKPAPIPSPFRAGLKKLIDGLEACEELERPHRPDYDLELNDLYNEYERHRFQTVEQWHKHLRRERAGEVLAAMRICAPDVDIKKGGSIQCVHLYRYAADLWGCPTAGDFDTDRKQLERAFRARSWSWLK